MTRIESDEDKRDARASIFAMLQIQAQDEVNSDDLVEFFKGMRTFYLEITDEDRITAENMSDQERDIVREYLEYVHVEHSFEQGFDPTDSIPVFQGLVAFRCELIPELLRVESKSYAFIERLFGTLLDYETLFLMHCETESFAYHDSLSALHEVMSQNGKYYEYGDVIFDEYQLED
ncbi:hypothetical protein PMAYCL1PPCAC_05299 [Pristionchus mayeri]|uniref:Uncharacterized protein n=1 Tax=Pristionchus mayeri TaxID=1317129 RepID=A0AAN5CAQ4_9BILA|nr:hypothetical protein PMAYCL1PPCAC_05299 [Pristionchus mayeri]